MSTSADLPLHQRRGLLAGVAVAALAGGAGLSWVLQRPRGAVASPADAAFWSRNFTAVDGTGLSMQAMTGRPLLVNFWATWCPPCVEELPLLDSFYRDRQAQGWQVLGIAVDRKDAVQAFLQKMPLSFPVVLEGMGGIELSRGLGNSSGALPFSVAYDGKGVAIYRKIGKVSAADLAALKA